MCVARPVVMSRFVQRPNQKKSFRKKKLISNLPIYETHYEENIPITVPDKEKLKLSLSKNGRSPVGQHLK